MAELAQTDVPSRRCFLELIALLSVITWDISAFVDVRWCDDVSDLFSNPFIGNVWASVDSSTWTSISPGRLFISFPAAKFPKCPASVLQSFRTCVWCPLSRALRSCDRTDWYFFQMAPEKFVCSREFDGFRSCLPWMMAAPGDGRPGMFIAEVKLITSIWKMAHTTNTNCISMLRRRNS